jgi:ABC-type antimicrobial peptide transport system permease subunit
LIVGVVDDVRQFGLNADAGPQVYVPITQMPYPGMGVVIRATQGDPRALLPALSRELRALDPNAGVSDVRLLDEVVEQSLARQRFSTTIIAIFAAVSLLLAMVGLYSVIALGVRQRRREFGVRMALGAAGRNVIGLVMGEGAWVTTAGLLLGIVGAVALNEVLASMLFEASALDPRVFAAAVSGVAAVSLAAAYVPARRAIRVHPTEALRSE